MTERPEPPPRSRGNGLLAPSYRTLADLDPRVADVLLARLRDAGIAAFAEPPADLDPLTKSARAPRLADRVWVDTESLERARAVLASERAEAEWSHPSAWDAAGHSAHETASAPLDEDAAWRDIVAMFHDPAPEGVSWPAAEGEPPQPRTARELDPRHGLGDRPPTPFRTWTPAEPDDDEHYVPPDPPAPPRLRAVTVWALLAIVGGVALLVLPSILGNPLSGGWDIVAVALVTGGAASLVYRMRDAPPTDSGPDDGAVV